MKKLLNKFPVLYRMSALSAVLLHTTVTGFCQVGTPVEDESRTAKPVSIAVDTEESRAALSARLNSPNLTAEKRAELLGELEASREALMDEYLAEYRKTIRENHKLHPEDPWLAAEKIQAALQKKAPLIERHNHLADLLDQHAPVIRPDTNQDLRTHLAKLPAAHREYFEAVQAARHSPSNSFDSIAAAQAKLQTEMATDPINYPEANSSPIRDSPQRQAHFRRLHQSLIETHPAETPPLAEFLHAHRISLLNEPSTNPTKP